MTGCQVIQAHQARHPIHNTRLIALDQFDVHAWAPVSLMRFNPNGAQVDQQRLIGTRPPTWPTRPPGIVLARRYAQRVTQSDDWHGHTLLIDIGIDPGLSLKRAEAQRHAGSAVQPADNRARDRF